MHTLSQSGKIFGQLLRRPGVPNFPGGIPRGGGGNSGGTTVTVTWSDYINSRLDDADSLCGVPLSYLVPDPALLPAEGLRFFTIDPRWVLALRRGLLSAGVPETVRPTDDTGAAPGSGLTGLLLSSALVAQYPGLIVRAWTGSDLANEDPYDSASGATAVTLLQRRNLTPRVLLCIFATVPDLVVIEEPHGLARLGIRRDAADQPVAVVRDRNGAAITLNGQPLTVPVPFRGTASDGVVDVSALAQSLQTAIAAHASTNRPADPSATSSALALQLLQPPVRQRFSR